MTDTTGVTTYAHDLGSAAYAGSDGSLVFVTAAVAGTQAGANAARTFGLATSGPRDIVHGCF